MTQRIGGMNIDIMLDTTVVHTKSISLDITDNTAVAQTRGIPDGWIAGDAAAEGEFEMDTRNFQVLGALAKAAGSWRGMGTVDITFYANTGDESHKVVAYGCKLIVTTPIGFEPNGGETASHTVKYLVTSPDFVEIDGTRVLSEDDTRDLLS